MSSLTARVAAHTATTVFTYVYTVLLYPRSDLPSLFVPPPP